MTYNEKKSLYESIMKDIAKTVKRKINEAVITGDSITDQYVDEQNGIKVEFTITSISNEESMFFYTAFVIATVQSLNSLFINVIGAGDNRNYKDWNNNSDDDTQDRIDVMAQDIYIMCIKNATNGYTVAKKMKKEAPSFGFEFDYKVIE